MSAVGQGISGVLTFAIGVAISPVPIIAVVLMLFSRRAAVNGSLFLAGWVLALTVVSVVAYVLADQGDASTSSTTADTISWGKIVFGVLFLVLAGRTWRKRPSPTADPDMPAWLSSVESLSPVKAHGLGWLLAGVNPKNLLLTVGAATGLAQLGLSGGQTTVSIVVFVALASLTIAAPVAYHLVGGARASSHLDDLKGWLVAHNAAVMTVLFLVFGVDLIAKALPPLTGA